jgi:DNA excision repair protein ERCC-8
MMAMTQTKKESICSLVSTRQHGRFSLHSFERRVSRFFADKELLQDPEIISPHRTGISSLSLDHLSGRFLLAGSADATLSIYDISKWGSEGFVRGNDSHSKAGLSVFRPVARSRKVQAPGRIEEIPNGHSSSITHVQWYPVDTGAFLSSASDGSILLWDTNSMQPVLHVQPFSENTWGSAHLQTGGDHSLIAAGSWYDVAVKLVDVRSGSHSHQLLGHDDGITCVQWSPTMPVVLASGSRDGSIRLWDIRKSGSKACITTLNREAKPPSSSGGLVHSYKGDYSHLRSSCSITTKAEAAAQRKSQHRKQPTNVVRNAPNNNYAPNNYKHIQSKGFRSHNGHVSALSFLPGGQSMASVGGADGELLLWDLRHGCLAPSKFVAPGGLQAATPKRRKTALCIDGSTIWVGHKEHVLGFSIDGGSPRQELRGHLRGVTSMERMDPGNNLMTGSQDGMILCWGKPKMSAVTTPPVRTEDHDSW